MTDIRVHRLERQIRERAYDLTAGTERARDVRESLSAELDAVRPFIQRQDALRLEVLIDRLTGMT